MSDKPAEQPKEEKKEKKEKKEKGEGKADKKAAKAATIAEKLDPPPAYIASRIALFDDLYKKQQDEIAAKESVDINVTLPDGKVVVAKSWRITPLEIAKNISEGLARDAVISKVNGNLWDLPRVLEGDCTLQFLKFDDDEAKAVFWHSSAHVLGEAMELHSGCSLCYGPPIQDGFYYDAFTNGQSFSEANYPAFESLMGQAVKEKQPFQRLVMTKEDLLKMFDYNEFKKRIINEKIDTPTTTVYRCGPLIDLCRGPHVPDTSRIKAFAVTKSSSTYWEGKADAESLQRVYGISFPDKKMLKEWQTLQEEAAKRDHRKIGKDQELFFFHEWSPGSCFFLPKGAHIYNKLVEFIKKQYWSRGFTEVVSPNMYNAKLWEVSGHWEHYADDMFQLEVEKEKFALKPMNCPGHCLMFQHRVRSYRELPLRFADFGVLHRNELSGALTGLTRVRRFQQDDAHIFCMFDQIESEIAGCLDFLKYVYGTFGFTFELNLSTRPEKFLGEKETWDAAEAALANALNTFGQPWKLNPGDGAFYGPKIDIRIKDAIKRSHQCATIQLDFQLPQRFKLEYVPAEAKADEITRPVILHRAVLGSVERMIAILCENYGGKWPFWLSPRQATIVPVHPKFTDYAIKVRDFLRSRGFVSELDIDDGSTLNKKIRNAQLAQYNFILVVGEQEEKKETVNVRSRDNAVHGERTLEEVAAHFTKLATEYLADENFPAKEGQAAPVAADAEADADAGAAAPAAAAAAAAAESSESGTKTAVV